jgi:hypothetical protein
MLQSASLTFPTTSALPPSIPDSAFTSNGFQPTSSSFIPIQLPPPPPPPLYRLQLRKILSDVDDTLFASGGKFPAGVDKRYPGHTVYPGVIEFYKELDLGANHPHSETGKWSPMVFFISVLQLISFVSVSI